MTKSTRTAPGGRERLLDSAEALFAQRGYDAASMREITRLAGVELGLANYHFGTKDRLYREVLARRAPIMANDLDRALTQALAAGSLIEIFVAFAQSHLTRLHDPDPGWRNYIRLAAYSALRGHREQFVEAAAIYQPVTQRYRHAVGSHVPGAPAADIDRAFYVYHVAILSILIDAGPTSASHAPPSSGQIADLVTTMVRLFSGGIASFGVPGHDEAGVAGETSTTR